MLKVEDILENKDIISGLDYILEDYLFSRSNPEEVLSIVDMIKFEYLKLKVNEVPCSTNLNIRIE